MNNEKSVMDRIGAEPEKKVYKPLIGRLGKIFIILFISTVAGISLIYSEPGGRIIENIKSLTSLDWKFPQLNLNLALLSEINISAWMVSVIVAVFILVLTDAGLNHRRKVI